MGIIFTIPTKESMLRWPEGPVDKCLAIKAAVVGCQGNGSDLNCD